jgi:hypothetical protein
MMQCLTAWCKYNALRQSLQLEIFCQVPGGSNIQILALAGWTAAAAFTVTPAAWFTVS